MSELGCYVEPSELPTKEDLLALLVVALVVLHRIGLWLRRMLRRLGLWSVLGGARTTPLLVRLIDEIPEPVATDIPIKFIKGCFHDMVGRQVQGQGRLDERVRAAQQH